VAANSVVFDAGDCSAENDWAATVHFDVASHAAARNQCNTKRSSMEATTLSSTSTTLGAAGEHYVMCQLLRRGFIAALAPAGVPNADIIVTDEIGDRLCAVQVKARVDKGADGGWHMKAKHELLASDTLFYAFVDFGPELTSAPTCFIVPSAIVAEVIRQSHRLWLATPGQHGQQRKDGELRRFLPDYDRVKLPFGRGAGWLEQYRERWQSLTGAT
jgi:hypothetical protein